MLYIVPVRQILHSSLKQPLLFASLLYLLCIATYEGHTFHNFSGAERFIYHIHHLISR